jgi:hypothetical protein
MNLDYYLQKYGSDKCESKYVPYYESLFTSIKEQHITLLEIGIGTLTHGPSNMRFMLDRPAYKHYKPGASLRAFRDYFTYSQIYGIDIQEDCMINEERITTYLCNSLNIEQVNTVLKDNYFDIIIDDGDHLPENQIQTFENMFNKLKTNGLYFIEDVVDYSLIKNYFSQKKYIFEVCAHNFITIKKT